jgi:hypothetical protein
MDTMLIIFLLLLAYASVGAWLSNQDYNDWKRGRDR